MSLLPYPNPSLSFFAIAPNVIGYDSGAPTQFTEPPNRGQQTFC
jgi:hypothetical protein